MTKQKVVVSGVTVGTAKIQKALRVYAIGDIHGCLDELELLLDRIEWDLIDHPVAEYRIIFIGDYVDRGPDSKGVIDQLIRMKKTELNVTFLLGNHEQKLIKAFTEMDKNLLPRFLKYGGIQTLSSYGVQQGEIHELLGENPSPGNFWNLSQHVAEAIGKQHITFLLNLETSTSEGDYLFCHAGVDPIVKLEDQSEHDMIWMREPFLSWDTPLSKVIVHGHTPRDEPELCPHRINIDTACVYGEALTAVVLEGKTQRFLKVKSNYKYPVD